MVRFTVDNRNRLIFYGNPVGYVKADRLRLTEAEKSTSATRSFVPTQANHYLTKASTANAAFGKVNFLTFLKIDTHLITSYLISKCSHYIH